ncbi:MAG: FKBP-type peptidyl-prolyl cis-trans isomerase [Lewinellaceae bacterium]|nr:FKBP-type peptidyl-prolyl cis-trans isomerase [Lewinellaceae bacterium]
MTWRNPIAIFGIALLAFLGCSSDITDIEIETIQTYVAENKLAIDTSYNDVFIHFDNYGDTAEHMSDASYVTMKYVGFYLDNEVFDSTATNQPVTIKLSSLISGLQLGLVHFGKGGSGYLFIPSYLGFDNKPPYGMRKNAILAYQVEILDY